MSAVPPEERKTADGLQRMLAVGAYEDPNRHWWDDHDNVVMLAYWMRERDHGVDDFVSLIEKPWKWTTEYEQATADNAAEEAAADAQARLEREFKAGFDEVRE